jgi:hypothetical protein
MKHMVPNFPRAKARWIGRGQTVQEVIALIARLENAAINQLSLDGTVLPPDGSFDDFYQSKDQLFVFSKAIRRMHFPPSLKKGKIQVEQGRGTNKNTTEVEIDVPDGIVAHLTRKRGGNVHDRHLVYISSGSFEKETYGANLHSGPYRHRPIWASRNFPNYAAKDAADLETDSCFQSAYRHHWERIRHTRNNWICYDFKERRIVPTHYTIRTNGYVVGNPHLKSWLVEASADGETWREVDREEDNKQLNGSSFTGIFTVVGGGECRFIRLVNVGRNHLGDDRLGITAWEIFGSLIDNGGDPPIDTPKQFPAFKTVMKKRLFGKKKPVKKAAM